MLEQYADAVLPLPPPTKEEFPVATLLFPPATTALNPDALLY
jgi:hypothetical protein